MSEYENWDAGIDEEDPRPWDIENLTEQTQFIEGTQEQVLALMMDKAKSFTQVHDPHVDLSSLADLREMAHELSNEPKGEPCGCYGNCGLLGCQHRGSRKPKHDKDKRVSKGELLAEIAREEERLLAAQAWFDQMVEEDFGMQLSLISQATLMPEPGHDAEPTLEDRNIAREEQRRTNQVEDGADQASIDIHWREANAMTEIDHGLGQPREEGPADGWLFRCHETGWKQVCETDLGRLPEKWEPKLDIDVPMPMVDMLGFEMAYIHKEKTDRMWESQRKKGKHPNGVIVHNRKPFFKEKGQWKTSSGWAPDKELVEKLRTRVKEVVHHRALYGGYQDFCDAILPVRWPELENGDGLVLMPPMAVQRAPDIQDPKRGIKYRCYECPRCEKSIAHIRDCWDSEREFAHLRCKKHADEKRTKPKGLFGKEGHWKCVCCGNVAMERVFPVMVRFRTSEHTPVVWTMHAGIYGDGFLDVWLQSMRQEHDQHSDRITGRDQVTIQACETIREALGIGKDRKPCKCLWGQVEHSMPIVQEALRRKPLNLWRTVQELRHEAGQEVSLA